MVTENNRDRTPAAVGGRVGNEGVSVVIPAYNYAHFLPQAIDSALAQTYAKVEVIVVDDGSTDATPEVAARYGDRIRYIRKTNAGLPAARNTGIQHASHPFIGFLDADDLWKPEFLDRAMKLFAQLPRDYGLVASHALYIDEQGRELVLKALTWAVHGPLDHRDVLIKTRFSPSAVVARKSALEAAGMFDETLRSSEDRDMWIRIGAKYPLYLHTDRLALIRRHRNSMSRNAGRMKANIQRVLDKSREAGLVSAGETLFWLRARSFMYFQTAWMYYEQGNRWEALRDLAFSCLCWPFFSQPNRVNEPLLFRLRSCWHFLSKPVKHI
jgi:glycosyltransferase involved in cell wall biosynthesis